MEKGDGMICGKNDVELPPNMGPRCLECLRKIKDNLNSQRVTGTQDFFLNTWGMPPSELKKLLNARSDI